MNNGEASDNEILNDSFSWWIHCICVINFDVELGQILEFTYPTETILTKDEKSRVCYLSLPDSHSSRMGNTQHHFRFRSLSVEKTYNKHVSFWNSLFPALKPLPNYCFGYAFFRQIKNSSSRRNYFQKSVVILTPLPFDAMFYRVTEIVAASYFDNGTNDIKEACHDINKWPQPEVDKKLSLTILGQTFSVIIPGAGSICICPRPHNDCDTAKVLKCDSSLHSTKESRIHFGSLDDFVVADIEPEPTHTHQDISTILPTPSENSTFVLQNRDYYKSFAIFLPSLQHIWELVMTAQPIIVVGDTPYQTSQSVQSLVSCITPFVYAADYRPFFTIHDPEFREFSIATTIPPVILGVTNPFVAKTFGNWPNIIQLSVEAPQQKCRQDSALSQSCKDSTNGARLKFGVSVLFNESTKVGFSSRCRPHLKTDVEFFKNLGLLVYNCASPKFISEEIQKFLSQITMSFLIPLERYVSTLMPLRKQICPFKDPPEMGRFNMKEFFATLEISGPWLTCGIRGDWIGLYRAFFSGPHFVHWLCEKETEIQSRLESLHIDAIYQADYESWRVSRIEIEVVDMIIRLNQKIARYGQANSDDDDDDDDNNRHILEQLRQKIDSLLLGLPEDLQLTVRQSTSGTGASSNLY